MTARESIRNWLLKRVKDAKAKEVLAEQAAERIQAVGAAREDMVGENRVKELIAEHLAAEHLPNGTPAAECIQAVDAAPAPWTPKVGKFVWCDIRDTNGNIIGIIRIKEIHSEYFAVDEMYDFGRGKG